MRLSTILDVLVLVVLAVGGALLAVGREALQASVSKGAEKGVEEAVRRINWPSELARVLEQTRGQERQELRFSSYGALWATMRPLALYDDSHVDETIVSQLSKGLSDWYFSERGGLLLTSHVRAFYFTFQDLLRAVSRVKGWSAVRPEVGARALLVEYAHSVDLGAVAAMLAYLEETPASQWPGDEIARLAKEWDGAVKSIASRWPDLAPTLRFAVLQQVASVPRTVLTKDVDSRLR